MATEIRIAELNEPIDVADYLFRRLKQLGIDSIHGVPGDYNLVALDYVPKNDLRWVGNCNELNSAYAADGYARIKGMAALVTTFGVGELSALNGVAGAYSELVPVVHIVGTPSTESQRNGMLLHHTLGNGDFTVFKKMSSNISVASVDLHDPHEIPGLIDHAIQQCYLQSRPVYVTLPTDVVTKKVEGARLHTKLDLSFPPNDPAAEDYLVDIVLKDLYEAKKPCILVDACAIRHRALDEVHALIDKSKLPVFVSPMGKGGVDETLPTYGGVYAGTGSNPGVQGIVEWSDLILYIGSLKSDFNTSGFTYKISQLNTIDFHSNTVKARYSEYPGMRMNGVLRKVTDKLDVSKLSVVESPEPTSRAPEEAKGEDSGPISHAWLWPRLSQWLKPKDIVITETGTSNSGIWETRFPKDVQAISQYLWGSIGYATPSTQGAALAAKEMGLGRTILFTGDGSFQLTAQAVSTMIRNDLNPILFVICNDGYTVERYVHGVEAAYNDINNWSYKELIPAFAANPKKSKTFQVKTQKEMEDLFCNEEFSSAPYIQLVEVYMDKMDAPPALKIVTSSAANINAKED